MNKWRVGTLVCGSCGAILNIKSKLDYTSCYLCEGNIDLSELPMVEDVDIQTSKEAKKDDE
jgi:hypothetical protein